MNVNASYVLNETPTDSTHILCKTVNNISKYETGQNKRVGIVGGFIISKINETYGYLHCVEIAETTRKLIVKKHFVRDDVYGKKISPEIAYFLKIFRGTHLEIGSVRPENE